MSDINTEVGLNIRKIREVVGWASAHAVFSI